LKIHFSDLDFWIESIGRAYYIPKKRYVGHVREFTKVMKALSDPNRVKIIKMLPRKVLKPRLIAAFISVVGTGTQRRAWHTGGGRRRGQIGGTDSQYGRCQILASEIDHG